ncbi:MAG: cytochrome c nitrite reductase small subunit [Anaerolineaceae bacterium]|jgi:cytochrome c nitrite reductase small subunit|nr:cytochrome c nitrite reductase small subunit [Anaerolineaceae bacterium]
MKVAIIISIAALLIVAGALMVATDFTAYLGSNPVTCNNCHLMDAAYEGWYHAAHASWANCVDCHAPHSFVPKYLFKAYSGYRHVTGFLFKEHPTILRAIPLSKDIIQENCIGCHETAVEDIAFNAMDEQRYCVECHRSVAHGERGISILPFRDQETDK